MSNFDFNPFAAILLDLDGTLFHDEHALPGAAALVARLQQEGREYACLTNSTLSPADLRGRLSQMGIDMPTDRIFTAASAAVDYALSLAPMPHVLNLANTGVGALLSGNAHDVQSDSGPCDAIIIGAPLSELATEDRRRLALVHARRGAKLIGICADRVYPSPRGLEIGVGALTMMLAYAANSTPIFTGKPEAIFFNELCQHLQVDPARCLLIGDNLESDIAGAKTVKMKTILVLTGVTAKRDVSSIPTHLAPDWIINDLTEL